MLCECVRVCVYYQFVCVRCSVVRVHSSTNFCLQNGIQHLLAHSDERGGTVPGDDPSPSLRAQQLCTWTRTPPLKAFDSMRSQQRVPPLPACLPCRYSTVAAELLPTPAKMHYLFNLRDLSKVFQGMSAVGMGVVEDKGKLVRLWVHEVSAASACMR